MCIRDRLHVEQGVIAGCAGGLYDNIAEAAAILDGCDVGSGNFDFSVYPPSVPVELELVENGVSARLLRAGAVCKPCFCGPCFGAGDVPANDALSIRHTTRNFPNREGSKPGDGQLSGVIPVSYTHLVGELDAAVVQLAGGGNTLTVLHQIALNTAHLGHTHQNARAIVIPQAQLYIAPVVIRTDGVLLLDAAAQRIGILF